MNRQKKDIEVFLLLGAIAIAAIIGAKLSDLSENLRLSRYGVETQGKVTSKEREQHQHIWVEYEIGNREFKSLARAGSIGKEFESVQINEKVPVFYDSDDPASASIGNPIVQLKSSIIETFVVSLIPIFIFLSYKFKNSQDLTDKE